MTDPAALLQLTEPGGATARWNFPAAIGTPLASPGGLGEAATVSFGFLAAPPSYDPPQDHPGFVAFDAAMQAAAQAALQAWAAVCGIGFAAAAEAEAADIAFGREAMAGGGFTWFPAFGFAADDDGLITAVAAWAKNDHLGFQVLYLWNGSKRKFIPDFLVRFRSGKTLVLEIKGQDSDQERAKRSALAQWVDAVNAHGGFGTWAGDVVVGEPAMARDVIDRHA
jgi:hypothetical protein